ncbi:MAG TPA: tetratricopeptide repeat protein [Polyangiaceae bacterium]
MRLGRSMGALLVCAALVGCLSSPQSPFGRAIVLADKGQARAAIDLLEKWLREHPNANRERRLLVRLYGTSGDLARARTHTELLARSLGASSPVAWLELGHALELAHRYDEALALFDKAGAIAPRDPAGPRTGGLRAAAWGELDWAEPRLVEAARRDPTDGATWHALGVVRVKKGDLEGAEQAYRTGLACEPEVMNNRVGLATLALVRGDAAQVLREYEAILRVKPDFVDAHLGRSWALVRLGRFTEAAEALALAERLGADRRSIVRQRRWLAAERAKSATSR